MTISGFNQNNILDQLDWSNFSDEQKQNATKSWSEYNRCQIEQLITDNIVSIIKEWNETLLLSDSDIKFITTGTVYEDNKEGKTATKTLGVCTLLEIFSKEDLVPTEDKTVFFQDVIEMNSKGIPVVFTEKSIDSTGATKRKILMPIPEFAKEQNLDENILFGVSEVSFNSLFTFYPRPLFDELVNEQSTKHKSKKQKLKTEKLESEKEDELYSWLRLQGLDAHRQVKTSSGNKLDIWIPNQMILEVKRSNVSGNDVCQAMEYVQSQCLPVVIVGDKISSSASRGLKAFNNLTHGNKIIFVTWDAIKDYLKGRFNK